MQTLKELSNKNISTDRYGNKKETEMTYKFEVPAMEDKTPPKPDTDNFPGEPRGTDTEPTWLTPGENVMNAEVSRIPGVQPMLDKLNELGRQIQEKQGGPIPTYTQDGSPNPEAYAAGGGQIPRYYAVGTQADTSWVNNELLDALKMQESGNRHFDEEGELIKNPAGTHVGAYQWGADKNIGYNVDDFDRSDYDQQRNATRQYLIGMQNQNPNWTKEQVLQAYNWGPGNMGKYLSGNADLTMPTETQKYGQEILSRIQPKERVEPAVYTIPEDTTPGWMSAQASTLDNDKKESKSTWDKVKEGWSEANKISGEASKYDVHGKDLTKIQKRIKENKEKYGDNIKLDAIGNVAPSGSAIPFVVGGRWWEGTEKGIPIDLAYKLKTNKITQTQYDLAMDEHKKKIAQKKAYKEDSAKRINELNIKRNIDIDNDLEDLDNEIAVAKANGNKNLVMSLQKKKRELIKSKKPELKNNNEENAKLTAQSILSQNKKKAKEKGDPPPPKPNTNEVKKAAAGADPKMAESVKSWFTDAFKDLFSGPELARGMVMYLGSRAMGYDHHASLSWTMEGYLKRVDEQAEARQEFVTHKDNLEDWTLKSLKKFRHSGDVTDLIPKGKSGIVNFGGKGSRSWMLGVGVVEKQQIGDKSWVIKLPNGQTISPNGYLKIDGKQVKVSSLLHTYDDDQMDSTKLRDRFFKTMKEKLNLLDRDKETEDKIPADIGQIAQESASLLYKDMIRYAAKPGDIGMMYQFMDDAQRRYLEDYARHKENPDDFPRKPQGIEGYYNQAKIKLLTTTPGKSDGLAWNDIKNTSNENWNELNKSILNGAEGTPGTKEHTDDYRSDWRQVRDIWKGATKKQRDVWTKSAETGYDGLTWWLYHFLRNDSRALELVKKDK